MCYFRIPFVQLKRNERYTNLNKPNRCKILCISMFPNDNSMKMSLNNEKTHLKRIYTWWTYTTDKYFEGKNETETNETTRSYHKPQIQDFIQSIQFLLLSLLQTHLSCSTANYSIIILQFIYYWIRSKFIWIFNNFQPKVETNAWTWTWTRP